MFSENSGRTGERPKRNEKFAANDTNINKLLWNLGDGGGLVLTHGRGYTYIDTVPAKVVGWHDAVAHNRPTPCCPGCHRLTQKLAGTPFSRCNLFDLSAGCVSYSHDGADIQLAVCPRRGGGGGGVSLVE